MSPGINVLRKEVKEANKLLTPAGGARRNRLKVDVKLAGNRYRIQLNECSEGCEIVATRWRRDLSEGTEEVAIIVKEEHYIVVGIALMNQQVALLASCRDLACHFQGVYGTVNNTGV